MVDFSIRVWVTLKRYPDDADTKPRGLKCDSKSLGDPLHFYIWLHLTKLSLSTEKGTSSWYITPGEAPAAVLKTLSQFFLCSWFKHSPLNSALLLKEI